MPYWDMPGTNQTYKISNKGNNPPSPNTNPKLKITNSDGIIKDIERKAKCKYLM